MQKEKIRRVTIRVPEKIYRETLDMINAMTISKKPTLNSFVLETFMNNFSNKSSITREQIGNISNQIFAISDFIDTLKNGNIDDCKADLIIKQNATIIRLLRDLYVHNQS